MAKGAYVIPGDLPWQLVSALLDLRAKTPLLLQGIIQFRKAIGDFHAGNVNLKAFRYAWIIRLLLGQRRNVRGELVQNRRLNQLILSDGLKQKTGPFPVAESSLGSRIRSARRLCPGIVALHD